MSFTFVREFLKSPSSVGAIWPSSLELARLIVEAAGVSGARHVLELGPGNGAVTGSILESLQPGAKFLAIEKSPSLASKTARRYPSARILEGCATQLSGHLRDEKFGTPDAIVSGLPWASFPEPLQKSILGEVAASIHSGSTFTSFAYFGPHWLPAGRRFRQTLGSFFSSIQKTRIVLNNLPPAFVYVCKR